MNLSPIQSLIFLAILTSSFASLAVQVTLKQPKEHRKELYSTFETKKVVKLALIAIRDAIQESEPENAQLINQALIDGDFKKQANVVYFDPPLDYAGDQLPQLYIYKKGDGFNASLQAVLWAATHSPHHLAYSKAIKRIRQLLATRGIKELEEGDIPVNNKLRVRKRARAHSPTPEPEVKRNAVDPAPEQDVQMADFDFQFVPDEDWGRAELEQLEHMDLMWSTQNSF